MVLPHREVGKGMEDKVEAGTAVSRVTAGSRKRRFSGVSFHNFILANCHVPISAALSSATGLHNPEKLWAVLCVGKVWASVASARRVIAQALGIKRQLLKVWFFGTRLASFEVANTNVANHLVFHGFFLAGASEVAVVHSFRQATAMAMQVRASFSEVEDESTSFQIPEPLGVDQAMTVDRHKISLEGTVGSQERPGSHKGFGSFSQNYHFGPGKFIPSEASPFIGARPRVIDGDDGVGRGREDGSCMAAACMAALALPEAPTVISRNPNSNSGRATSSNPPIDNPGRCYEIPQLPAEHVE
jgi:hypothetical protein